MNRYEIENIGLVADKSIYNNHGYSLYYAPLGFKSSIEKNDQSSSDQSGGAMVSNFNEYNNERKHNFAFMRPQSMSIKHMQGFGNLNFNGGTAKTKSKNVKLIL